MTSLVVFDLDFTLWDCNGLWCDCLTPPFRAEGGEVRDRSGRWIHLYDEVIEILDHLDGLGIDMALASRTSRPDWACELLDLLGIADRFAYQEIFPASKLKHFANLRKDSGLPYSEMLFFDDEDRNIKEVGGLGVDAVFVTSGVNRQLLDDHLVY